MMMNNSAYKNYLSKYKSIFRKNIVLRDEGGVYKIYGKYGEIGPYDPENQRLGLWYMGTIKHNACTRRGQVQKLL